MPRTAGIQVAFAECSAAMLGAAAVKGAATPQSSWNNCSSYVIPSGASAQRSRRTLSVSQACRVCLRCLLRICCCLQLACCREAQATFSSAPSKVNALYHGEATDGASSRRKVLRQWALAGAEVCFSSWCAMLGMCKNRVLKMIHGLTDLRTTASGAGLSLGQQDADLCRASSSCGRGWSYKPVSCPTLATKAQ